MWKILVEIREICYLPDNRILFPEEQKGCHKEIKGTCDLLYIVLHILMVTCLPSQKLFKLDEPDMQDTAGEAGASS